MVDGCRPEPQAFSQVTNWALKSPLLSLLQKGSQRGYQKLATANTGQERTDEKATGPHRINQTLGAVRKDPGRCSGVRSCAGVMEMGALFWGG